MAERPPQQPSLDLQVTNVAAEVDVEIRAKCRVVSNTLSLALMSFFGWARLQIFSYFASDITFNDSSDKYAHILLFQFVFTKYVFGFRNYDGLIFVVFDIIFQNVIMHKYGFMGKNM